MPEGDPSRPPRADPDGADGRRADGDTVSTDPTERRDPSTGGPDETTERMRPPASPGDPTVAGSSGDPADTTSPGALRAAVGASWAALALGVLTTTLVLGDGVVEIGDVGAVPRPGDPLTLVIGVLVGLLAVAHWLVQAVATWRLRSGSATARGVLTALAVLSVATDVTAMAMAHHVAITALCGVHLLVVLVVGALLWSRPVRRSLSAAPARTAPPRPGTGVVVGVGAAAVLLLLVQVAAFVGGSARVDLARAVAQSMGRVGGTSVEATRCSWLSGAAAYVGSATGRTCETVLDGMPASVEVTSQTREALSAAAVDLASLSKLEGSVRQLAVRQGVPVITVSCGASPGHDLVPAPPGTQIRCLVTTPTGPVPVQATVTDPYGSVSVESR